jgi:hypothetical protein
MSNEDGPGFVTALRIGEIEDAALIETASGEYEILLTVKGTEHKLLFSVDSAKRVSVTLIAACARLGDEGSQEIVKHFLASDIPGDVPDSQHT